MCVCMTMCSVAINMPTTDTPSKRKILTTQPNAPESSTETALNSAEIRGNADEIAEDTEIDVKRLKSQ